MAIDSDTVKFALLGNVECNDAQARFIAEELQRVLAERNLTGVAALNAENTVEEELNQWAEDLAGAGQQLGGGQLRVFLQRVEQRIDANLYRQAQEEAQRQQEREDQMAAKKQGQKVEAEKKDQRAAENGLPQFQHGSADAPDDVMGEAPMNGLVVAELKDGQCIMTSALSSCTGVSLYDPKSGVAAVLHVQHNKDGPGEEEDGHGKEGGVIVKKYDAVTIQNALDEMRKLAPDLDPVDLQVMLLPGDTDGVEGSHLDRLKEDLTAAGVLDHNVRDLSLEGRRGSTLFLGSGGNVTAFSAAQQQELNQQQEVQEQAPGNNVANAANLQHIEQPEVQGEGTNVRANLRRTNSSPNLGGYKPK